MKSLYRVIILLLLSTVNLFAVNNSLDQVSRVEDLSYMNVSSVAQDKSGLMWIGTDRGLYTYDSYQVKHQISGILYSKKDNIQNFLIYDNYLFAGTSGGLLILDTDTRQVVNFECSESLRVQLNESIRYLSITSQGYLWLYFRDGFKVVKIDTETNSLVDVTISDELKIRINLALNVSQSGAYTFVLLKDALGVVKVDDRGAYIDTTYSFEELFGESVRIFGMRVEDNDLYFKTINSIYTIKSINGVVDLNSCRQQLFRDVDKNFSNIPTGAFEIDPQTSDIYFCYAKGVFGIKEPFTSRARFVNYSSSVDSDMILPTSSLKSIYIDEVRNLWFLTSNNGLFYTSLQSSSFTKVKVPQTAMQVVDDHILSITGDNRGNIWYSTHLGSIYYYDSKTSKSSKLPYEKSYAIQAIKHIEGSNELLIGLPYALELYNYKSGQSQTILGRDDNFFNRHVNVSAIDIDKWGHIWVGTWKYGLYRLSQTEDGGYKVDYAIDNIDDSGHPNSSVRWVLQIMCDDATNEVFACSDTGLLRVALDDNGEPKDVKLYNSHYYPDSNILSNYVTCIDKESDSIYWLGTFGGGIGSITFDREDQALPFTLETYTTGQGIPSNEIEQILVGKDGDIWLGTNYISRFNYITNSICEYDYEHFGKMSAGATYASDNLYMGGRSIAIFDPENMPEVKISGRLILSDLYIHDQCVEPLCEYDDMVVLDSNINHDKQIDLHYKHRDFSIALSALDFQHSSLVKYRYRLIRRGSDNGWMLLSAHSNRAYFSNLNYGRYIFQAQVSLDGGTSWSDGAKELLIHVHAPWWWAWWSKALYLIITVVVVCALLYLAFSRLKLSQQLYLAAIEKDKEAENHQMRMRFFMNISHEFKTPLTIINMAVETLENQVKYPEFEVIKRNSDKLIKLIVELINFRRSDMGAEVLSLDCSSITRLVDRIYVDMKIWAEKRGLNMTFNSSLDAMEFPFDKEKMNYVIINLLSNAIKNTPQGGDVNIDINLGSFDDSTPSYKHIYTEQNEAQGAMTCLITVSDTGVGISGESIKSIFNRFFQVKGGGAMSHLGSGIGLALVKNWVLLHKGAIRVSSERGVGTQITISIPIDLQVEESLDMAAVVDDPEVNILYDDDVQEVEYIVDGRDDLPLLLIVEDNDTLRSQLCEHFKNQYNVLSAANGEIAYNIANKKYPDLIISDVMMPVMDGLQLCQAIRENLKIAYIPIILLTAKSELSDQFEGYELGADLYLPKPYSLKILDRNVSRLLSYSSFRESEAMNSESDHCEEDNLDSSATEFKRDDIKRSEDMAFIAQVEKYILENIERTDFSLVEIGQFVGLGRTALYGKIKDILGISLGEYVRDIRLEKARELLNSSNMQINQIMWKVGYETGSHFSKIFKKKYGMTPTEYINIRKQQDQ